MPKTMPSSVVNSKPIVIWLFAVAGLVFAMVVVGGITRLTGSGLSMVEWRPLMGIIPPLTDAEWQRVYALYQASPEYIHVNRTIGLDGFKTIFFWEYVHRLLGRLIGLAFALPLLVFATLKMIPKGFGTRLIILLGLGTAQGGIGWWMVQSGLVDDPYVSPYRLALHLTLALAILGLLIWLALDLKDGKAAPPKGLAAWVMGIVGITIVAGAFVAGLDGGKLYNEYPFMGEGLIPIEYGTQGWRDAFENPASAQFHHRLLAAASLIGIFALWGKTRRHPRLNWRAHAMAIAAGGQFLLGLTALLYAVPISLGVLHQGGAGVLLLAIIWLAHGLAQPSRD